MVVRPGSSRLPHTLIVVAGALVADRCVVRISGVVHRIPRAGAGESRASRRRRAPRPVPVVAARARGGGRPAGRGATFRSAARRPRVRPGVRDGLYVLFWNKLYFDEVYDATVVAPNLGCARRPGRARRTAWSTARSTCSRRRRWARRCWLWRVLEGRGLDWAVSGTAQRLDGDGALAVARARGPGIQGGVDRRPDPGGHGRPVFPASRAAHAPGTPAAGPRRPGLAPGVVLSRCSGVPRDWTPRRATSSAR